MSEAEKARAMAIHAFKRYVGHASGNRMDALKHGRIAEICVDQIIQAVKFQLETDRTDVTAE